MREGRKEAGREKGRREERRREGGSSGTCLYSQLLGKLGQEVLYSKASLGKGSREILYQNQTKMKGI